WSARVPPPGRLAPARAGRARAAARPPPASPASACPRARRRRGRRSRRALAGGQSLPAVFGERAIEPPRALLLAEPVECLHERDDDWAQFVGAQREPARPTRERLGLALPLRLIEAPNPERDHRRAVRHRLELDSQLFAR